jgi:hypothetical protein
MNTDRFTILLLSDIYRGSSVLSVSSVEGVYPGRIVYTSEMEDYFTILSVDERNNTIRIDGSFDYDAQNRILTVE